jgi:uncharacterized membrane protein
MWIIQGGFTQEVQVMSSEIHEVVQEKETGRIEAFSDGVFAIALTLLVLDIKVPPIEQSELTSLGTELIHSLPNVIAFAASFFFILVMWINHHRLFTVIRRSDNNLMLLNGLLLFGISLVPFTTALVAEYLPHRDHAVALAVYNGWFFLVAIFFNLLWWYASAGNRLFTAKTDASLVSHIARQYIFGPFVYLGAMLLGFVNPYLSLIATVLIAIFFALPNKGVQQLIDSANTK